MQQPGNSGNCERGGSALASSLSGLSAWLASFASLALCFGVCSTASAQSTAVVLPFFDPGVPAETSDAVVGSVSDYLAGRDILVLSDDRGTLRLPKRLRQCYEEHGPGDARLNCAKRIRRRLEADCVVLLTVSRPAGSAGEYRIRVDILDRIDVTHSGEATVQGRSKAKARRAGYDAAAEALNRLRRGPGPWLIVTGTPDGATVLLNEVPVGHLPGCAVPVEPGLTHLIVRHPGYRDVNRSVKIPADPNAEKRIEIDLVAISSQAGAGGRPVGDLSPGHTASQASDPQSEPASGQTDPRLPADEPFDDDARPSNLVKYLVGGGLIAVGLVLAIPPIIHLVQGEGCAGAEGPRGCEAQYESIEWFEYAGLALGGGMIAGGLTVILWPTSSGGTGPSSATGGDTGAYGMTFSIHGRF